jgi:hypothetical protein
MRRSWAGSGWLSSVSAGKGKRDADVSKAFLSHAQKGERLSDRSFHLVWLLETLDIAARLLSSLCLKLAA